MAQLLIFNNTNTHPDPTISTRGCWKRGDIVLVREDDQIWGNEEKPPTFSILKIPGVPAVDLIDLELPLLNASGEIKGRRANKIDLSLLTPGEKAGSVAIDSAKLTAVLIVKTGQGVG